jgi:hypothetical protein
MEQRKKFFLLILVGTSFVFLIKISEGGIIVGITARSILEFFGIIYGIPRKFGIIVELLEFHWDYCTMRNFNYFPLENQQKIWSYAKTQR